MFLVPLPDPQFGKSVVGPRTFLAVWEFIWYNCCSVCGLSDWQLYGGVNGDLLQEGLRHTLCDPGLLHPEPLPLQQATAGPCLCRRYSDNQGQIWLSFFGISGSLCAQGFVWVLWASLVGMGFDSKHDFTPSYHILGHLLCPWMLGNFMVGSNSLLSMVLQQWVTILELSQEKMSTCPSAPRSCSYFWNAFMTRLSINCPPSHCRVYLKHISCISFTFGVMYLIYLSCTHFYIVAIVVV